MFDMLQIFYIVNTCAKISKCLYYYEGECDPRGQRQVCLTSLPLPGCPKRGETSTIQGACIENDFRSLRGVGEPGNGIVTKPWAQERHLCQTGVLGGTQLSFGIRDHHNITSEPHSINIAGSMHPVDCSQYTSVCSYEGNLDIRLTFPVTACPQNCTCNEWEAKTECSASCGFGTQIMEQRCRGNGCLPPLIRTKMSACRKHNCGGPKPQLFQRSFNGRVDGRWTEWSAFSICSVSCGGGQKVRTRSCTNPPPANCGATCEGKSFQLHTCNARPCLSC
ncbi:SSPO [Bugula neritina]|uniref:SSPO n=1 Tax=Bugula neritina TaxID=10212 RepID=A0A7J7J7R9_BUGNE|nr:SSPO [Bugula neritina]